MGVDLRGIFQRKVGDRWKDIEPFQIDNRHYDLFGWLSWGGDRSGSCSFKPLAPERGFPDDFKCVPGDLYTMANGEKCPWGMPGTPGCLEVKFCRQLRRNWLGPL
jgi:hypothetical protein